VASCMTGNHPSFGLWFIHGSACVLLFGASLTNLNSVGYCNLFGRVAGSGDFIVSSISSLVAVVIAVVHFGRCYDSDSVSFAGAFLLAGARWIIFSGVLCQKRPFRGAVDNGCQFDGWLPIVSADLLHR